MLIITASHEVGQVYVFTLVCNSVHRGVCPIPCWDTPPWDQRQAPPQDQAPPEQTPPRTRGRHHPPDPRTRYPPGSRHPPGTRHPPVQCMLGDTGNKQEVCILLECNLVIEIVTASKRSCGKVMLLHVSPILSSGGWE